MPKPVDPELRSILADNIQILLDKKGLNAQSLALLCGCNPSVFTHIKNQNSGASIDRLGQIAPHLGVQPWELLHPTLHRQPKPGK